MSQINFNRKFKTTYVAKAINNATNETVKDLKKILPSPFMTNKELKEFITNISENRRKKLIDEAYVRGNYAQISEQCSYWIVNFCESFTCVKLIFYIAMKLEFESNKIYLNNETDEVKRIVGIGNLCRYINILVEANIIRRTTKKNIYVVNHDMIFKGNYTSFIDKYMKIYKPEDVIVLTNKKVVLDTKISYGK